MRPASVEEMFAQAFRAARLSPVPPAARSGPSADDGGKSEAGDL
ncbi:hypothetical protein [Devosia sp.]